VAHVGAWLFDGSLQTDAACEAASAEKTRKAMSDAVGLWRLSAHTPPILHHRCTDDLGFEIDQAGGYAPAFFIIKRTLRFHPTR